MAHSRSLVVDRFECLRLVKEEAEGFRHYVNRLKDHLRFFNSSELKEDELSCLLLLLGLKSPNEAVLRMRFLHRINEEGPAAKFNAIVEEAASYISTIADAKLLHSNQPASFAINQVSKSDESNQPPSPCKYCQGEH